LTKIPIGPAAVSVLVLENSKFFGIFLNNLEDVKLFPYNGELIITISSMVPDKLPSLSYSKKFTDVLPTLSLFSVNPKVLGLNLVT